MATTDRDPERLRRRDWGRGDTIALFVLILLALSVRLVNLADPNELVFDETYYAKDACLYFSSDSASCELEEPQVEAHPPLGKWLIGLGIEMFGFDSFGWRIAAAIAGTISVALLYLLARKLLRSTLGATLAAGFLALDLLHVVQSRIAMLDIFVPLFGVASVLFVVYDRDHLLAGRSGDRRLVWRPWRIAAGIAAGAATASKWSGIFFIAIVVLLSVAWEVGARRRSEWDGSTGKSLGAEGVSILLWLILLPVVVYVLTYAGRVDGSVLGAPWSEGSWLGAVGSKQVDMFRYHTQDLIGETHPYQSPAWSWILVKRPMSYFFNVTQAGDNEEILALGNPFVWWSSILAIAYTTYSWIRNLLDSRRLGESAMGGPEGVIVAGVVLTYGPWLLQQSDREAVFIFYLLPTIPFMCLALGYIAGRIGSSWEARGATAIFAAATIGLFAYFHPLLTKRPLAPDDWQARIWFEDCEAAQAVTSPVTSTQVKPGGRTIIRTTTTTLEEGKPTEGWCWI